MRTLISLALAVMLVACQTVATTQPGVVGVELAARAGFNPHAAVSVWQKMLEAAGGGGPQFLSTHPSTETRLADLKVYADRVMPLYQQSRR